MMLPLLLLLLLLVIKFNLKYTAIRVLYTLYLLFPFALFLPPSFLSLSLWLLSRPLVVVNGFIPWLYCRLDLTGTEAEEGLFQVCSILELLSHN